MSNLYELTNDMVNLQWLLYEDVEDDVLKDTLDAVKGEYEIKLENLCKVIRNLEADKEAHKTEADRHDKIAKTIDNNIKRLKDSMFNSMKVTGTSKVKGELFTVSIQKNGGKVPLIQSPDMDIRKLPNQLVTIIEKPNTDAIRSALEGGNKVSGFSLGERGESLRIK